MKRKSFFIRVRNGLFPGRKARRKAAKLQAKRGQFQSGQWRRGDAIATREYESYDSYLRHQASKLDTAYERRAEKNAAEVAEFARRFADVGELIACRNVLCLGARLGAEVKALRDLGFFAVGIDLNPGNDNPYVHHGDFHRLAFHDASVDAVYTNALDHVFDLASVVAEVHRVLRPDGLFLVDALPGFEEGFLPGKHEATHWRRIDDLLGAIAEAGPFERKVYRDLGPRGRNHWIEAVFRKPRAVVAEEPAAAAMQSR